MADQLVDANAAVGKVATEVKQSKMKIKHLEKELKAKNTQLSSKQKEATTIEKEHQTRTAEVKKITSTLQGLKFDETRMDLLEKVVVLLSLLFHHCNRSASFKPMVDCILSIVNIIVTTRCGWHICVDVLIAHNEVCTTLDRAIRFQINAGSAPCISDVNFVAYSSLL